MTDIERTTLADKILLSLSKELRFKIYYSAVEEDGSISQWETNDYFRLRDLIIEVLKEE